MRTIVLALIAVPVLAFASPREAVVTMPAELPADGHAESTGFGPSAEAQFTIGTVDTIGGSTYDWATTGPMLRFLVNSPGQGVHALWMFSASDQTAFPDRSMRYNYCTGGSWTWIDPDFMASGVNVFTDRNGFGCLDVDSTGAAVVSCHHSSPGGLAPLIGRDMAPGAGIFDYCNGEPTLDNYAWPWVRVGANGTIHIATMLYNGGAGDDFYYSKGTTWCSWDAAIEIPPPQPHPAFPDHAIAESKAAGTNNVCATWEYSAPTPPDPAYYRLSTDGGESWEASVELVAPSVYGGDTVTSYHITGLHPFYDSYDRLHLGIALMPIVDGSGVVIPAKVYHWCPDNDPEWSLITVGTCDTASLMAPVGYNALYACRPSFGEDQWGNLHVAWERFDSSNVEPATNLLRADIFYSYSTDNGMTWEEPTKLTEGGDVTYRFPCMMDYIEDTVMVMYIIDQQAGFFIQEEGAATNNPYVVHKFANPAPGVAEGGTVRPRAMRLTAVPNPFDRSTRISYEVPHAGRVSLVIYDAAGRTVRTLVSGRVEPGRFDAVWDGKSDAGERLGTGVYLYRFDLGNKRLSGKLTN